MEKIKTYLTDSENLSWEISELAGHFHATCFHHETNMVGSGFALNRETAKKKAFSEINERFLVSQLNSESTQKSAWGLLFDESCSGFAVGYDRDKTVLRSLCEACERWTLSKWIDDGFAMNEFTDAHIGALEKAILGFFAGFTAFEQEVPVAIDKKLIKISIVAVLCWTDDGVFAGYGTKTGRPEAFQHALVESLRNFVIYKNQPRRDHFPYDRIHHFAKAKQAVKKIISSRKKPGWPAPRLKMFKEERFGELWLVRAIFDGWKPWQRESLNRFLY